jgi:tetratricopeptide (TPR) repeat protein
MAMQKQINKKQIPQRKQIEKKIDVKNIIPKITIKEQWWWKWIFIGLAAVILIVLPLMSFDAGNSGDEDKWQYPYSEYLYKYYTSLGKDTSYINDLELEYSGYAFDAATMFVIKAVHADNPMKVRHAMNGLMGALLILFVGLFARLIGGWRAGCIALLLLFFSPQILGQSFNNPKDIPFAAFFMGAIYYIAWFIKEFPNPTWKTGIKLGVLMGATIGIRPGGFLLIPYFGLFVLIYYIYCHWANTQVRPYEITYKPNEYFSKTNKLILKRIILKSFIALCIMFVVMFILWPYALKEPSNIISSFKRASHFDSVLRQLYEGTMIWSDSLPWYYTIKLMLLTSPIVVFLGATVYLFTARRFEKGNFWLFVLLFCFIFPIFWVAYSKANVYGGWRHSLFVYPTLVITASLGFNSLVLILNKNKYIQAALTALPFILLVHPIVFTFKNHPYEYVYFNELAGGIDKAYGNYEMDYYYHSTRAATEWIIANAQKSGLETGDKIIVSSWHTASVGYFLRHDTAKFQNSFSRWYERSNNDWDYAIFVITGMQPEQIKCQHFPPKNTVHVIKVDDKPICFILKREDKSDLRGFQFKQKNQIDSAIYYFNKAIEIDPYDEVVMTNLIETYFQIGNLDSAKVYIDRILDFLPNNETVNFYLTHYYLAKNQLDDALAVTQKLININFKNAQAYRLASNIYLQRNDLRSAEKMLEKLIDIDQLDNQTVKQLVEIYKFQGLKNDAAAYKKLYTNIAKSLEKRGKKEEAEKYYNEIKKIY